MKNKKPLHKQKKFEKKENIEESEIDSISADSIGKKVLVKGLVDSIAQTDGPTLFFINDGTGTFTFKGFFKAGERSYPDINEGDSVSVKGRISEYNGELEGEISSLKKEESGKIKDYVENKQRNRAKPEESEFLVKSNILNKLKDSFVRAATEIRLAIIQNRPIIVRHHNDADGYSSGYALERAILPLIIKQHRSNKAAWEYYTRAPCAAPFYEINDSIKDTSLSLRNAAKFSNKMPLVVIADNGSSPEDLFGIKQGKVHGMEFVVVDHHAFDEDVITQEVLAHINPFLVGESGAEFSAGMLCVELARIINKEVNNINQIAAMAGKADRINNKEVMDQYIKIAEKEGYSESLLNDIAMVIDFVSAKLKFLEAREYIEVVFGEPREKQKKLVELMAPYITNMEKKGLEISIAAAKKEKVGKIYLQQINIEENFPGFGFYPKPGKCVGMVHDWLSSQKGYEKVVSIGLLSSAMTIRATDEANFSVHELMKHLNENVPSSFVEGGGHKNAGSINFIPSKKEEILEETKKFIRENC